jgi:hypothetical protein
MKVHRDNRRRGGEMMELLCEVSLMSLIALYTPFTIRVNHFV